MGRPKTPGHKQKTKIIRFLVTEREFLHYQVHKERLLNLSPTLSASDIFRKVSMLIDDKAFLYFINLDKNDELLIRLRQEYDMSFLDE